MADFNSLLSKQISTAFGSLQSRYASTPQPKPLPRNQSATFSNFYKFSSVTLQWCPLTLPGTSHIEAGKRLCIFVWDIGALAVSAGPEGMSKAMSELKSLLPAPETVVVLLRNVPARLLTQILSHPFIRHTFLTSDINALCWPGLGPGKPAESGTVVLVGCESENLLQAVFRVRVAFGEQEEGGEDVCFIDFRTGDRAVGRVGILAGEQGAEAAGEWVKAEGVRWGAVAATEGLIRGVHVGQESRKHGVFRLSTWEIDSEVAGEVSSESGLVMAQFRIREVSVYSKPDPA